MGLPDNLKFTKDHEWIRMEGNLSVIGITEHAQDQLGDIVYVELPDVGEAVEKGDSFGVVESVKAVSDIYAAISGEIVEVNDMLIENPETINEDSYGEGWLLKIKPKDTSELEELLNATQYQAFLEE